MKHLTWIITLPLTIAALVFAIANRQSVTLDLWPFEIELSAPLFIVVLLSLFVGFLVGGMIAWFSAGRTRSRARSALYRAEQLERENTRLRQERDKALDSAASHATVVNPDQAKLRAVPGGH